MNEAEIIEEYGEEAWDKMKDSKWLEGITVSFDSEGNVDIPRSDVRRAYRAEVLDEEISALEWD